MYGLRDPRDGLLKYVGKSSSGLRRPNSHRHPCRQKQGHHLPVYRWVRSLERVGLTYVVDVLQECGCKEELPDAERAHIFRLRNEGTPLLNLTDGGDGSPGCIPAASTRQKMRVARLGRVGPNAGKSPSEETRRKQAASLGLKPFVDQHGVVYYTKRGAERLLGLHRANIDAVLKGRQKHTGGYVFKYVEQACLSST